jgi:predicted DNA-binding ribbon-helix-helix protein
MQWIKNRRIGIQGRQTSLRLEPEFWFWLRQIAAECEMTATQFIGGIALSKNPDRPRGKGRKALKAKRPLPTTARSM